MAASRCAAIGYYHTTAFVKVTLALTRGEMAESWNGTA